MNRSSAIKSLMAKAVRALNQGAYKELIRYCEQILSLDPKQSDAWFFASIAAAASRNVAKALEFVDKALALQPNNAEYLAQKAKLHSLVNQYEQALAAAGKISVSGTKNALVLDTIGVVYSKLGRFVQARDALSKAVALQSGNPQFHFNLASVEQFLGNIDAAAEHFEKAISLKPDFARAHWSLSELGKTKSEAIHTDRLEKLLQKSGSTVQDKLYLCHALSREYEKQGDYARAFEALVKGKKNMRSQLKYSFERDEKLFSKSKEAFPAERASPSPATADENASGERMIFVMGMPRSGTTLLDRMLASHSQVSSLGEIQDFALAVRKNVQLNDNTVLSPNIIEQAATSSLADIGERYLSSVAAHKADTQFVIDKTPLNFLYVGFIMNALPKAKIVCLRRNAMDTVLSNYRQLFAIDYSYYGYHYDLLDTARYYALFEQLMTHWREMFGNRLYEVSYERLVTEPEPVLTSTLAHLGLEWQAECLEFHNSKEAVSTASSVQVREKLYSSASGRWKKYSEQLKPVQDLFDTMGIEY
ncbi:MAG: sulfotransferase [Pseudomonadota bacterium]